MYDEENIVYNYRELIQNKIDKNESEKYWYL